MVKNLMEEKVKEEILQFIDDLEQMEDDDIEHMKEDYIR